MDCVTGNQLLAFHKMQHYILPWEMRDHLDISLYTRGDNVKNYKVIVSDDKELCTTLPFGLPCMSIQMTAITVTQ